MRKLVKGLGLLLVMALAGCETPSGGQEGDTTGETSPQFDPAFTVCSPFTEESTARERGIVAQLKYLTPDMPRYTRAVDYIQFGVPVETTVFFNKLFIPTRPWDRGFITQEGQEILTSAGDTLYEYFGLELRSQLKLGAADTVGAYQLALLSDDGAIMYLDTENGLETIVDNDGTHATRMGCATDPIYLAQNDRLPINIKYYQGPRFHIALTVLWREWPADGNIADPLCGQSGNSKFFDSTQIPPAPKQAYLELLARGWKVLENDNYALPDEVTANPCTPAEEQLMVNGVTSSVTGSTTTTIFWNTNLPSTSVVNLRNVATGQTFSYSSATMVTTHVANLSGLAANTLYAYKVQSTSASGQVVTSEEFAFKTRR